jgi:hypothetical protein
MPDLQDEISRLEARLAPARASVIDELAKVRQDLSCRPDPSAPLRLADLRIASPCKERWADMIGDDRVRVCNGCERPVFDLSEMTLAEAEAVLATRGVTPCVRFYRRADGTVMTADCAPGARRKVRIAAVAAGTALLGASPAIADPVPEPTPVEAQDGTSGETQGVVEDEDTGAMVNIPTGDYDYTMGLPPSTDTYGVFFQEEMGVIIDPAPPERRPVIEWSGWARIGLGTESQAPDGVARSSTPRPRRGERRTTVEAALGAELTLPIALRGDLRFGAWTEVRTSSGPVLGAELQLQAVPNHLDLFGYDGRGILSIRAGGNAHVVTGAIAYGYLAPWKLWGPWDGATRYVIGVRAVASVTRSVDDPREWTATAGLELEPVGAFRYLLGIRSWY